MSRFEVRARQQSDSSDCEYTPWGLYCYENEGCGLAHGHDDLSHMFPATMVELIALRDRINRVLSPKRKRV